MSRKKDRQPDKKKPTAGAVELTESQLEETQGGLLPAVKPSQVTQKVRETAFKINLGSVKINTAGDGSV